MEEEEDEEFISLSDGSGGAEVPLSLQDLEAALTALQYRRSVRTSWFILWTPHCDTIPLSLIDAPGNTQIHVLGLLDKGFIFPLTLSFSLFINADSLVAGSYIWQCTRAHFIYLFIDFWKITQKLANVLDVSLSWWWFETCIQISLQKAEPLQMLFTPATLHSTRLHNIRHLCRDRDMFRYGSNLPPFFLQAASSLGDFNTMTLLVLSWIPAMLVLL